MMRKVILSIIMFAASIMAFAEPDVKLRIGLQGGYNLTKWGGDFKNAFGTSFKNGFSAGALFEIQVNQRWSIQPALLFSIEGTKLDSLYSEGVKLDADKVKVGTMGIKFPVDVMVSIHNVGPGRLVPSLGLYVTGNIGGKINPGGTKTFGKESIFQKNWEADKEQPKDCIPDHFDYGLAFKMMYELESTGAKGVFVQAGFSYGFTSCQNMNIMANVGYRFQYVKKLRSAYNTGILEYNP